MSLAPGGCGTIAGMDRRWCLLAAAGLGCATPVPEGNDGTTGSSTSSTASSDDAVTTTPETGATDGLDDTGTTGDHSGSSTTDGPSPAGPTYDAVRQKSSHNSFQRSEALIDQLAYHRIRSLELDLHVGKTGSATVPGDWFVYHTDIIDDDTSCRMLSSCLDDVGALVPAVPEHEVVTLWLDLKDDWGADHAPAELDAMLFAHFGDSLWGPAELLAACPGATDLADAATDPACGWPELSAMRGRFVVMLTGGDLDDPSSPLSTYLDQGTLAFVAPSISSPGALDSASPRVAVYNARADGIEAIAAASSAGFVTRAWNANDEGSWDPARDAGAHHLATDAVNLHRDPWTITHDDQGWPFTCMETCDPVGPERGHVLGFEVDSGDIWDTADDMLFAQRDETASPGGTWSALVSTPNSWVEPFAKACLMARAGLDAEAPYLAVCRPADTQPLRVQWRSSAGGSSSDTEHDVAPAGTVEPSSAAWIRLEIDADGLCATGYGAWRPNDWIQIDRRCFEQPLTHQGLAASSHGAGPVRLLFLAPRHDDADVDLETLVTTSMGGASGGVFAGPIP